MSLPRDRLRAGYLPLLINLTVGSAGAGGIAWLVNGWI